MHELNAARWVREYGDILYRYALARVNDGETARDLVQDTFLSAWKNSGAYKGEASEKNWLFAILKNKIIDYYRKASTRLTKSFSAVSEKDDYFDDNGHWIKESYAKDWGVDYNSKIESKEFYDVLGKCKSGLKEIQNMVFSMKYLDGMESEEICKELNITASNYWVILHRAKVQLRGCLEKNWFIK